MAWARHNAALNGLAGAPIRWISDDAAAFAERELRRGRRYAGIVLDPPSYGHGSSGRTWRLAEDLPNLLAACIELLDDGPAFVILLRPIRPDLARIALARSSWTRSSPSSASTASAAIEVEDLALLSAGGTRLHLGSMARWSR